jgi:hypothetical protein
MPSTVTNNSILGGYIADSNLTSGMTNNYVTAAFAAIVSPSHPSSKKWDAALYVNAADSVITFEAGNAYADGVKMASITGIGANASGVMKVVDRATSTAYYVPLYSSSQLSGA